MKLPGMMSVKFFDNLTGIPPSVLSEYSECLIRGDQVFDNPDDAMEWLSKQLDDLTPAVAVKIRTEKVLRKNHLKVHDYQTTWCVASH